MSTPLHVEEYGEPGSPVVVFLHGLLGSSRNWRSVARDLAGEYRIFALDLPEHGSSPHSPATDLKQMIQQINQWLDHHIGESYVLCGHSLGGKVAMGLACARPQPIKGLVVVDIAPRDYPPAHHLPTLEALLNLDLSALQSRKQADEELAPQIPNWAFRQFLLTNLSQKEDGFFWRCNLPVLHAGMVHLSRNPLQSGDRFDGPTLFLRGGKSGYLRSEHIPLVREAFAQSQVVTLPEAGHDLHVEDKKGFLSHFRTFLLSVA